jgi:hypothetical protein
VSTLAHCQGSPSPSSSLTHGSHGL